MSKLYLDKKAIDSFKRTGQFIATDFASLSDAITAAANGTLYFPHGTYAITADLVIPSTIKTIIPNGAILAPDFGKILTINGNLDAGSYQIFDDYSVS